MTLIERLAALCARLNMEGQYVDANIVWLAIEAICRHEGLNEPEVPAEDRSR